MSIKPKRILCVDDDTDILDVAKSCLEIVGGYEVLICSVGPDAVERVRSTKPDVVVLDVMMPGMDGPSILKEMQADPILRKIPVVFMTATVQPREVENYLELGASAVIAKPFDPMLLATEVESVWKKSQTPGNT